MARAPHPQRERARQLRREGQPLSQIAEACGVTKVCVSKWCRDLPEQAPRFVQTSFEHGLTREHAGRLIAILAPASPLTPKNEG